jgi:hypothetical protein
MPVKPGELSAAPIAAGVAPRRPTGSHAVDPTGEYRVRLASGQVFPCRDLTTLQKWIVERRVGRDDEVAPPGATYRPLRELHELDSFFEVVDAADHATVSQPAQVWALPAAQPSPPPPPPPASTAVRRTTRATAVSMPIAMDRELAAEGDLDTAERAAIRGSHGLRNAIVAIALLGAAAAGVWFLAPGLVSGLVSRPPAEPPPPPAAPQAAAPAQAPAPAPPAPEPAPAPAAAEKPVEPPPAAPVAPRGPKALVAQAERLRDRGDCEKALDLYERAAELDPDNADALAGRGLCYLDLEQNEAAVTAFKEALRVDPEHEAALVGSAEAYRSMGRAADAIKHYEKYLAAHPDGDEAPVARNALEALRR